MYSQIAKLVFKDATPRLPLLTVSAGEEAGQGEEGRVLGLLGS